MHDAILATTRQAILQATDESGARDPAAAAAAVLQQVQARLASTAGLPLRRLINATGVMCIRTWDARCWPRPQWRICKEVAESYSNLNTISSAASAARAIPTSKQR